MHAPVAPSPNLTLPGAPRGPARADHILIIFHDFLAAGSERIAIGLARRWLDAGRRVTVLCGSREGGLIDTLDPRAEVIELDPPIRRSLTSRAPLGPALMPHVRRIGADVIFVPGNYHFVLSPWIRRAAPTTPMVAKVSNPLLPPVADWLRPTFRFFLKWMVDPYDALVYMAPELAEQGRIDLPDHLSVTIAEPNLPDDYVTPPRQPGRDRPLILTIGRMMPQKNLALAIRAFAELRRTNDAELLILGEGKQRPMLERLVASLGLQDSVRMPGFSTDTARWMAEASALLLSSRYEGYPAVAVEALAADLPLVTTPCTPSLNTLIASPLHGEIVGRSLAEATPRALADALRRALALPFASNGVRPASVMHHKANASASAYLELFDQVVWEKVKG